MNTLSAAALSTLVACSLPLAAQQPAGATQSATLQSASPQSATQDSRTQDSRTQESRTGVSTPPAAIVDNIPAGASDSGVIPGYQPTPSPNLLRRQPQSAAYTSTEPTAPLASTPDAAPAPIATPPEDVPSRPKVDIDAGIVTDVPHAPGELPIGTTFKARMKETLSTVTTQPGTPFSAELIEPVQQDGRILIPSGTILEGNVTEVHGGRRIHGTAALHLEPLSLVLPDGSRHLIRAQVIDTSESFATRIDAEGTIIRRDHIKQTLAGMGLATGSAVVAGAVLGGGVGALVGAGVGVGLSTAWWLKQDRQTVLPEETAVTFSLNEPVSMRTGGI